MFFLEILKKLITNPRVFSLVVMAAVKLIFNNMQNAKQDSDFIKEPLFLPRGTIRALLALILLATSIADFAMNSWTLPEEFHVMTIAAVAYYIGYRSDNAQTKEIKY